MFDTNPNLIQDGSTRSVRYNATPLVLFHDGGGTIFSYYLLDNIGRTLLGIANPRFRTLVPWAGGLHEMATSYAALVADAVSPGPVIIGGWSLGGLLALEVAHVLSEAHPDTHVLGLIMIDSVCPLPPPGDWGDVRARLVERRIEWPATTKSETKVSVEWCFREAHRMVREWVLPTVWQRPRPPLRQQADSAIGRAREKREGITENATRMPPVVLLRSQNPVPVPDGVVMVDLYRKDRSLGWDNYRHNMFFRIFDIPGHHYDVFAIDHLETVSDMIRQACQAIEERPEMYGPGVHQA